MMNLIGSIELESRVTIHGTPYAVWGKALYVTEKNPQMLYAKIFLAKHHVLMISPSDLFLSFGKDRGNLGDALFTQEKLAFEGRSYKKALADYQIPITLCFGDPTKVEGEVSFVDFLAEDGSYRLLSLGKIMKTGARADSVADVIFPEDLVIS